MASAHRLAPALSPTDALTVAAYRGAAAVAKRLPRPAAEAAARAMGTGMALVDGRRRRLVTRHLRRVEGAPVEPLEEARRVGRAFGSYARYWVDAFRLDAVDDDGIAAGMRVEGYDRIAEGVAGGRGVILALPHLGGWEWGGRWLRQQGHGVSAVVEALHPPRLFEWFAELRRRLGISVIPLGPHAGREVLSALHRNHVVCLLCDRDIGGTGVEVEFFAERTTLPGGPATLAIRSGAPLLPAAVYFGGPGHLALVRPALDTARHGRLRDDVARVTQELAWELEGLIRRAPDQWHLMQPNWPSDPGYPS